MAPAAPSQTVGASWGILGHMGMKVPLSVTKAAWKNPHQSHQKWA